MPAGIRIDTFHGFPHVHFTQNGKKHEIKIDDFELALEIVNEHTRIMELIKKNY
ncbi:MAG: hypothetical protein LBC39_07740 [Methanobrevibacter sp.]|jgi:hypothetical protein|nr:hypothetical protein [Candidatus Methanovirga aequatorialis]